MRYSVFLMLCGALGTVLLTPAAIGSARLLGAIDTPDGGRHLHERPTPRLGGLSPVFVSILLALLFLPLDAPLAAWLTGGALIAALGVSDDLYSLSPRLKLCAMLAIAALPAAFGLSPTALTFGAPRIALPHFLGDLLCILWVLLLINAFNLIDGADGLAATQAMVGALALFLSGAHSAPLLLFGTALGFLPYNLPLSPIGRRGDERTRSFLGDTGALFLGYSLAVLSLRPSFSLVTPFFFAIPIFDLLRVMSLRLFRRKNPFRADRTHLHHRLADLGYTKGELLILCTLYAILLAFCALLLLAVLETGETPRAF